MKILVFDIETAPHLGYVWALWKQSLGLNQLVEEGVILCWVAKWVNSNDFHQGTLWDDGKEGMIRKLHALMEEADLIVAHNGDKFDIKHVNSEIADLGLAPPSASKTVDTLKVARARFRLPSYKLDYLCKRWNLGRKLKHEGFELWLACMSGKRRAQQKMLRYNKHDVKILQRLYYKLRPWIKNHPQHGLYKESARPVCSNCGSHRVHKKGMSYTARGAYQRYKCSDCGTPLRGTKQVLSQEQRANTLVQEK